MREVKKEDVGEILQHIYDSEIHLKIGWMWDGGVDFIEGTKSNDFWGQFTLPRCTGETDIAKAISEMCDHLVAVYPNSSFAGWYKANFREGSDETVS